MENFFNLVDKKKIILPKFDCFAYGFPCNDYSNVGEHLGIKGKFGPLYTYGVELINRYKPTWFVAENVGGIKSSNEGKTFIKILKDLKEIKIIEFDHMDVVRHPLVSKIIRAYQKKSTDDKN